MRKKDAIRLGWNGQNPGKRERMWAEAIHPEDLERIRKDSRPGKREVWKIEREDERTGNGHCWQKVAVTITGCYRHLVTAVSKTGRNYSMTYVEMAMERRKKRGKSAGK